MNKRKNTKSKGPAVIFLIIVVAFLSYGGVTFINQQGLLDKKQNNIGKLEGKIVSEKKLNEQLKDLMKKADTDEYREKIAREKLGMVKPGERVYVDIGK